MIVQCTQCKARFRVADEKVPDRGVKVRCTKCSNVFRVTRAAGGEDSLPPGVVAPGALPGNPPLAQPRLTEMDPSPVTKPPPASQARMSPAPGRNIDPFSMDEPSARHSTGESVDPFELIAPSMVKAPPSRSASHTPVQRPVPAAPSAPPPAADPPANREQWESLPPPTPKEETDPFAGLDVGRQASLGHKPLLPSPSTALRREILGGSSDSMPASRDPAESETSFKARHDFLPDSMPDTGAHATASDGKQPPARIVSARKEEEDEDGPQSLALKSQAVKRARRWAAGAAANILGTAFVAFVALVVVAEVRSPRPLTLADLGPNVVELALGSDDSPQTAQLHATELQTGVYPLRSGEQIVYVQGIARNDTSRRLDAMYVSLDLMKDGHVVEHQEAVAGVEAGGEDLFELTARKNDELQRELTRRASGLSVEAHKSAPFVGVFAASVDSLQGAEVRATAHEGLPKALVNAGTPAAPAHAPTPEMDAPPTKHSGHTTTTAKVP